MEKQSHLLLWKAVFVLILVGLGFGIYAASKSIDYTWRWERIPQYIINTEATTVRAPFDGTATLEKGNQLVVTSDYGDDPLILNKFDTLLVSNGDLVFEGDPLVEIENWNIGPLTWGLVMTLQLSVVSLVFAVVIGLFAGLARLSSNPALRYLSITYIELIRGTPLLVQIFIFYFFIGTLFDLDRFTAGVAAFLYI